MAAVDSQTSFEISADKMQLRSGFLVSQCDCSKRNGLQSECNRCIALKNNVKDTLSVSKSVHKIRIVGSGDPDRMSQINVNQWEGNQVKNVPTQEAIQYQAKQNQCEVPMVSRQSQGHHHPNTGYLNQKVHQHPAAKYGNTASDTSMVVHAPPQDMCQETKVSPSVAKNVMYQTQNSYPEMYPHQPPKYHTADTTVRQYQEEPARQYHQTEQTPSQPTTTTSQATGNQFQSQYQAGSPDVYQASSKPTKTASRMCVGQYQGQYQAVPQEVYQAQTPSKPSKTASQTSMAQYQAQYRPVPQEVYQAPSKPTKTTSQMSVGQYQGQYQAVPQEVYRAQMPMYDNTPTGGYLPPCEAAYDSNVKGQVYYKLTHNELDILERVMAVNGSNYFENHPEFVPREARCPNPAMSDNTTQ